MKLKEVASKEFCAAVVQLMSCAVPIGSALKLKELFKATQEHQNYFQRERDAALKKFAVLEEDKSIRVDGAGAVEFANDESRNLFLKEIEEVLSKDVEIPSISLSSLGDFKIEARALVALEKIINE